MKAPFEAGDVVVCVGSTSNDPLAPKRMRSDGAPPKGTAHRVLDVVFFLGEWGVVVSGYPSAHPTRAWIHSAFRKIDADVTEDFREMLRKLPVKGKVIAHD